MPRTRSRLSSSVTTSRVWPEEMQRRSAVSTSSDRSTVTTAGIGVITWRASCSCRWKTPLSMPASPASSLPPARAWPIRMRSSSGVAPSSDAASRVDPQQPQDRVGDHVQQRDEGLHPDVEGLQRAGDPDRDPVRVDDRVDLGDLLADDDVGGRDDHVGDRHRDADLHAVGEAPEDRLEDRRDRRLAEEADAQRGERDAELAGRQVLVEVVVQLQRAARAGVAVVGHLLQRGAA